ncbi:hypothetical protein VTK56DRAFT_2021 [Thermocarpiscus australiensis]
MPEGSPVSTVFHGPAGHVNPPERANRNSLLRKLYNSMPRARCSTSLAQVDSFRSLTAGGADLKPLRLRPGPVPPPVPPPPQELPAPPEELPAPHQPLRQSQPPQSTRPLQLPGPLPLNSPSRPPPTWLLPLPPPLMWPTLPPSQSRSLPSRSQRPPQSPQLAQSLPTPYMLPQAPSAHRPRTLTWRPRRGARTPRHRHPLAPRRPRTITMPTGAARRGIIITPRDRQPLAAASSPPPSSTRPRTSTRSPRRGPPPPRHRQPLVPPQPASSRRQQQRQPHPSRSALPRRST